MTPEEIAAKEAADKAKAAEAEAKAKKEADEKALQNDEVKKELERQKQKDAYTEKERIAYKLRQDAEKAKALGIDWSEILGNDSKKEDSEIPEWYKREQAKSAQKTAIQLADEIADEDERTLTKRYLSERIVPSGDPHDDFRVAFSAVRALKNKQILEDVQRRTAPRTTAAGGSQSFAPLNGAFEPTDDEAVMMRPPYNLSKEKILEARKKTEAKQR